MFGSTLTWDFVWIEKQKSNRMDNRREGRCKNESLVEKGQVVTATTCYASKASLRYQHTGKKMDSSHAPRTVGSFVSFLLVGYILAVVIHVLHFLHPHPNPSTFSATGTSHTVLPCLILMLWGSPDFQKHLCPCHLGPDLVKSNTASKVMSCISVFLLQSQRSL